MIHNRQKLQDTALAVLYMFVWGFVFLDRLILSQESDIIISKLNLSSLNFTSLTAVNTGASVVGLIVLNILSDKCGKRKMILCVSVFLCGLFSLISSFCSKYYSLAAFRILAGFFAANELTLMTAILSVCSKNGKLGFNVGIVATGVAIFANMLGPVAVTRLAVQFDWFVPFRFTGTILIFLAFLLAVLSPEISPVLNHEKLSDIPQKRSSLLKNKNFIACMLIGIFAWVGYWSMQLFAPIYLSNVMGMTPAERGKISSLMGFVFIFLQMLIPALSDKIGRKSALIIAFSLSLVCPLTMVVISGSNISVVIYCLFGGMVGTTSALFGNVIVMESLPENEKSTAGGFVMAGAELIGGTIWPILAGKILDAADGLSLIMIIVIILYIATLGAVAALTETNPVRTNSKKNIA